MVVEGVVGVGGILVVGPIRVGLIVFYITHPICTEVIFMLRRNDTPLLP